MGYYMIDVNVLTQRLEVPSTAIVLLRCKGIADVLLQTTAYVELLAAEHSFIGSWPH